MGVVIVLDCACIVIVLDCVCVRVSNGIVKVAVDGYRDRGTVEVIS